MSKIRFIHIFSLALFLACMVPLATHASSMCAGTRTVTPNAKYVQGLSFSLVSNNVSGATNTLIYTVHNLQSSQKTIEFNKFMCRCKEHIGSPLDPSGLGVCYYYWSPSNPSAFCQTATETMVLGPNETKTIQASASQFNNMQCGSFQLDFMVNKINGVTLQQDQYKNLVGASFTDMCQDCQVQTTPPPPAPTPTCSSDSQCGTNGVVGGPFCQLGGVYQNYRTFTCLNPGTSFSQCTSQITAQLVNTCFGDQTCSNGTCVNNQTPPPPPPPAPGCTSHSYTKCSGNAVYWFDSCGKQEDMSQQCTTSQQCLNAQCQTVICQNNYECGNAGYVDQPYCQGNKVYQNYKTYTCNNPGSANSTCTDATTPKLKQVCLASQTCVDGNCASLACQQSSDCGTNGFVGTPFCQNGDVYQNYTSYSCSAAGQANAACQSDTVAKLKTQCLGNQQCSNGACTNKPVTSPTACSNDSQCGSSGYTGQPFCQGNSVYQNYNSSTCINPNSSSSQCVNSQTVKLLYTCNGNQTCHDGSCQGNPYVPYEPPYYPPTYQPPYQPIYQPTYQPPYQPPYQPQVLGASTVSTGLTDNLLVDSFILPLMITLLGIWMIKLGSFSVVEQWIRDRKRSATAYTSGKQLQERILKIQKEEYRG